MRHDETITTRNIIKLLATIILLFNSTFIILYAIYVNNVNINTVLLSTLITMVALDIVIR